MRAVLLVAMTACSGGTARPPAPISTSAPRPPATVSAEAANRALHDDSPLDYDRPFAESSPARAATTKMFHARCEAGDKAACIVEAQLLPQDEDGKNYRVVEANCRTGDLMSCRALPIGMPQFSGSPGAWSRRPDCAKSTLESQCDLVVLRKECTDGFPNACGDLVTWDHESAEVPTLLDRWQQLSAEGCKVGIADECMNFGPETTPAEIVQRAERLCDLRRDQCGQLSFAYTATKDSSRAREAFERACQYGSPSTCLQLAESYRDGTFEEPKPGRGQALLDWGCPKVRDRFKGKLPKYFEAICKRANLTSN